MKTAPLLLLIMMFEVGCVTVSEPPAPACPYVIISASSERLAAIQTMVRSRVGTAADVSVSGPYTRPHLDWLAAHGRWENPKQRSSGMLIDAIVSSEIAKLMERATPAMEIYFWQYFAGSGAFPSEGAGFLAVDRDQIVGFVETFHAG